MSEEQPHFDYGVKSSVHYIIPEQMSLFYTTETHNNIVLVLVSFDSLSHYLKKVPTATDAAYILSLVPCSLSPRTFTFSRGSIFILAGQSDAIMKSVKFIENKD